MRIALAIVLLVLGQLPARADAARDSDQVLTVLARWGLCVVDQFGEDEAKSLTYAAVTKVDANFQRQYGRKATDFAQDAYGENFVRHYYEVAKPLHDPRACPGLSQHVIDLVQ